MISTISSGNILDVSKIKDGYSIVIRQITPEKLSINHMLDKSYKKLRYYFPFILSFLSYAGLTSKNLSSKIGRRQKIKNLIYILYDFYIR